MSKAQATNKSNKKNGSADTIPPTDAIPFDDAVVEGKEIVAKIEAAERGLEDAERDKLRLGELAAKVVHPKYGDRTLAKFAKAIGVVPCTLARYRDVYRAYEDICAPGRESIPSYAVLRELATHPDRAQIIRKNSNLTKREALDIMRKFKGVAKEKQQQEQEDEWLRDNRRWFKDLLALANEVHRAADVVDQCTPEQLEILLQAIDPCSLMYVRGGGRRLFKLANRLAELLGAEVEEFTVPKVSAPIERAHQEAPAQVAA
jgi:hypothetical protein